MKRISKPSRLSMKECGTLMPVELCPPRKSVASYRSGLPSPLRAKSAERSHRNRRSYRRGGHAGCFSFWQFPERPRRITGSLSADGWFGSKAAIGPASCCTARFSFIIKSAKPSAKSRFFTSVTGRGNPQSPSCVRSMVERARPNVVGESNEVRRNGTRAIFE